MKSTSSWEARSLEPHLEGLSQEVCVDRAPARARERKRTRKYLDSGYVHVYEHEHVYVQGSIFHSLRYSPRP
jgi:hypothetical protein